MSTEDGRSNAGAKHRHHILTGTENVETEGKAVENHHMSGKGVPVWALTHFQVSDSLEDEAAADCASG